MNTQPIYEAAAFDHGFAPMLQDAAMTDECYRCPSDPAGRIDSLEPEPGLCRACLDEVSHRNEQARFDRITREIAEDGTDGGRWTA